MKRSSKEDWINGPGDLEEATVEDVPVKGSSILVQGLAASYSNRASSQAVQQLTTPQGDTISTADTAKLEILQFAAGCKEPSFNEAEAKVISEKYGPAFEKVVEKIRELSGFNKQAVEDAQARFQGGVSGSNGSEAPLADANGNAGSDVPAPAGSGTKDAGS